jgi:hypothetical protein
VNAIPRSDAVDVRSERLHSQRLALPVSGPAEVVRWLGALQAQDYVAALWGVGVRASGSTEPAVEAAVADGSLVRTWPMRGTLHFVAAEDVRWMLDLLAPRMIAASAGRLRQLELDAGGLSKSERLIARALEGGTRLTRPRIYRILEDAGVSARGARGLHILSHLSQRGVLCFGPREGKQPTFALLDEWAPARRRLSGEEALAELTCRYFRGHGPADAHDFAWWSGLTLADARRGIALASSGLEARPLGGRKLWTAGPPPPASAAAPGAHLLPYFDEYTVAYRERLDVLDAEHAHKVGSGGMLKPTIVIAGKVVGTWRRERRGTRVTVTPEPFARLTRVQRAAVEEAAARYAAFLGSSLELA